MKPAAPVTSQDSGEERRVDRTSSYADISGGKACAELSG
jgi:hypothetical protein